MQKIIKNDQVVVISGKDKGKIGKVLQVLNNQAVLVEGVNTVKKHQKPNPARNIEGGVLIKTMPLHISNVAILNPNTQKADRVAVNVVMRDGKQKRIRVFKSDGVELK